MENSKKDFKVCTGASCSRNYANDIIKRAKKHKNVNVITTCCMGLCALAPSVMLDGKIISRVNPSDTDEILGVKDAVNPKQSLSGPPILDDNGIESVSDLLNI